MHETHTLKTGGNGTRKKGGIKEMEDKSLDSQSAKGHFGDIRKKEENQMTDKNVKQKKGAIRRFALRQNLL